jgi:hypothetical protein
MHAGWISYSSQNTLYLQPPSNTIDTSIEVHHPLGAPRKEKWHLNPLRRQSEMHDRNGQGGVIYDTCRVG